MIGSRAARGAAALAPLRVVTRLTFVTGGGGLVYAPMQELNRCQNVKFPMGPLCTPKATIGTLV